MVLDEDVSNDQSASTSSSSTSNSGTSSNQQTNNDQRSNTATNSSNGFQELTNFIMQDKISFVLWLTRLFSIVCTISFIIPIFGYDQNTLYQKAIMASAATSALKLHQRMTNIPFQLSRDYFSKLFIEDSFHYLLYSFIFLNTSPITIVLVPIVAFALLHISVYTNNLLNLIGGPESFKPIRKLILLITNRDKDIMRFVAVNEIMLGPTILFMIITGRCGIFVPFIYYRFICMRYQSRRNPYSRIMFYELRTAIEGYSNQPTSPQIVRNLSGKLIALVTRFAPPQLG